MPTTTTLTGTYTNTINGALRTLIITSQDTTAKTIAGTWSSQINGIAVTFPVTGIYSEGNTGGFSSTVYFALMGKAQVMKQNQSPPTMRSVNAIAGYCDSFGSSPAGVDTLYVTVSWGEDQQGNLKDTAAWPPSFLNRT